LKRLAILAIAIVVAVCFLPQGAVHAQAATKVNVSSKYFLNRYGFAIVNLQITAKNNGSATIEWPGSAGIGIGLGSLGGKIVSANASRGFQVVNTTGNGNFLVTGGGTLTPSNSSTFGVSVLLNDVVTHVSNGSLEVTILTSPYFSIGLNQLNNAIVMPDSTQFIDTPHGFSLNSGGTNVTYSRLQKNVTSPVATVINTVISQTSNQDFHPLMVFSASRGISVGPGNNPLVTDEISFENMGTTALSTLYISPLTGPDDTVTVEPVTEPPLLNAANLALTNYGVDLTNSRVGYPVSPGANYTIMYQYPLAQKYYTISGNTVNVDLPLTSPIEAFVQSYQVKMSLVSGVGVALGKPQSVTYRNLSPLASGILSTGYTISIGWALSGGVPAATAIFAVLLLALFVSRTSTTEEESEEESATDRASAMIKAFEDKTSLINQLFSEIPNADPNERNKAYFDDVRGRLDTYRSRALQRLNEVKQKSTTQKFFDLLNQLHTTEREVDRAAKDTINLYEQFYTNRMRKEVFDRLLPTYRKRLERALDQLSEELHVAQREAKLL